MSRDDASDRAAAREDQQTADRCWSPAEAALGDRWREALLGIEDAVRLFERTDRALDLSHDEGASAGETSENIYRSALAVLGEGNLGLNLPATRHERARRAFDEGSVAGIKQSIGLGTVPPGDQSAPPALGFEYTPDAAEPDLTGASSFEALDVVERHLGGEGQLRLGQPGLVADCASGAQSVRRRGAPWQCVRAHLSLA